MFDISPFTMPCHKYSFLKKQSFIYLFPAFSNPIIGKFSFLYLKIGMVNAKSPSFGLNGWANTMKHLMIYNIRDKVRGKMRLVEQTVDFDTICLKTKKPDFAMPSGFALSTPKPSDL